MRASASFFVLAAALPGLNGASGAVIPPNGQSLADSGLRYHIGTPIRTPGAAPRPLKRNENAVNNTNSDDLLGHTQLIPKEMNGVMGGVISRRAKGRGGRGRKTNKSTKTQKSQNTAKPTKTAASTSEPAESDDEPNDSSLNIEISPEINIPDLLIGGDNGDKKDGENGDDENGDDNNEDGNQVARRSARHRTGSSRRPSLASPANPLNLNQGEKDDDSNLARRDPRGGRGRTHHNHNIEFNHTINLPDTLYVGGNGGDNGNGDDGDDSQY